MKCTFIWMYIYFRLLLYCCWYVLRNYIYSICGKQNCYSLPWMLHPKLFLCTCSKDEYLMPEITQNCIRIHNICTWTKPSNQRMVRRCLDRHKSTRTVSFSLCFSISICEVRVCITYWKDVSCAYYTQRLLIYIKPHFYYYHHYHHRHLVFVVADVAAEMLEK